VRGLEHPEALAGVGDDLAAELDAHPPFGRDERGRAGIVPDAFHVEGYAGYGRPDRAGGLGGR
jgi:hypothetical protein